MLGNLKRLQPDLKCKRYWLWERDREYWSRLKRGVMAVNPRELFPCSIETLRGLRFEVFLRFSLKTYSKRVLQWTVKVKKEKKIKTSHCNILDILKCMRACLHICTFWFYFHRFVLWLEEMGFWFSFILSSAWVFLRMELRGTLWNAKAKRKYFVFIKWMHLHYNYTKVFNLNCVMKPMSHYTNYSVHGFAICNSFHTPVQLSAKGAILNE